MIKSLNKTTNKSLLHIIYEEAFLCVGLLVLQILMKI